MSKKALKRSIMGFILGVFISYTITIIQSAITNNGSYYPVAQGLLNLAKTQMLAVVIQFFLSGLLGAVYGATTLFFKVDRWSIARQTAAHFCTTSVSMLTVALLCGWIPLSALGITLWVLMALVIYVVIWFICYRSYKKKVDEINSSLA